MPIETLRVIVHAATMLHSYVQCLSQIRFVSTAMSAEHRQPASRTQHGLKGLSTSPASYPPFATAGVQSDSIATAVLCAIGLPLPCTWVPHSKPTVGRCEQATCATATAQFTMLTLASIQVGDCLSPY